MTAYVVVNAQGALVSVGTVVANPLPAGLTATPITDLEFDQLCGGFLRWVNNQLEPTDRAQVEANQASVRDLVNQALAQLQAVIDTADLPDGTLSGAALSNAARQLQTAAKVNARATRRLIRLALDLYDATD